MFTCFKDSVVTWEVSVHWTAQAHMFTAFHIVFTGADTSLLSWPLTHAQLLRASNAHRTALRACASTRAPCLLWIWGAQSSGDEDPPWHWPGHRRAMDRKRNCDPEHRVVTDTVASLSTTESPAPVEKEEWAAGGRTRMAAAAATGDQSPESPTRRLRAASVSPGPARGWWAGEPSECCDQAGAQTHSRPRLLLSELGARSLSSPDTSHQQARLAEAELTKHQHRECKLWSVNLRSVWLLREPRDYSDLGALIAFFPRLGPCTIFRSSFLRKTIMTLCTLKRW